VRDKLLETESGNFKVSLKANILAELHSFSIHPASTFDVYKMFIFSFFMFFMAYPPIFILTNYIDNVELKTSLYAWGNKGKCLSAVFN